MFVLVLCAASVLAVSGWGVLAIQYSDIRSEAGRTFLAAAFGAAGFATLVALFSQRWRWRAAVSFAALSLALIAWWGTIEPSNDRDWQPETAVLSYATINGDLITVHNIRNFDYRSESDFTPAYYDRTFDMRQMVGADIVASYWMGPAVAHVFVSFAFKDGQHLAISIETRKERGEDYSTIKGFFKQYEIFYVVADERDVIRVRTNYRKDPPEDVYVYRVAAPLENGRRLLLDYVRAMNSLKEKAEFYNTLTTNCTTGIWKHSWVNANHLALSWKVLLSGYVPEYLYDSGRLDTSMPFAELQRRAHVNSRARAADKADNFSQLIRGELPAGAK